MQHVEKGKDVTSEIPEMYNLNFIAHLRNPTSNLGILKSSLNDEIVEVKIYSNPLEIPIKSDVTIHAFVVFKTVKLWDDKDMWWSLEKKTDRTLFCSNRLTKMASPGKYTTLNKRKPKGQSQ